MEELSVSFQGYQSFVFLQKNVGEYMTVVYLNGMRQPISMLIGVCSN